MKIKKFICNWYEIIKTKKLMLSIIWDKYESQIVKQYNISKTNEVRMMKEKMILSRINANSVNIPLIKITKIPDKIKWKYINSYFRELRQMYYLKTKTAQKYTNYKATKNDIYDIFLNPSTDRVKEISKKLVAKPHLQYTKYYLATNAKTKVLKLI